MSIQIGDASTNTRNASSVAAGSGRRTALKKNPISRGWRRGWTRRLQQVPFHSVSMLERAHRRYCFARATRGIALREAESAPLFPPASPTLSHAALRFLLLFTAGWFRSSKKKKGGIILAEESIVGREKNIKFSR